MKKLKVQHLDATEIHIHIHAEPENTEARLVAFTVNGERFPV